MSDSPASPVGPTTSEEHRAQGHWLLAKMGKRVLRPGGLALTKQLLSNLYSTPTDRLVEFGPGIGRTAELLLAGDYASYIGVEPDPDARERLTQVVSGRHNAQIVAATATASGLGDGCATVVICEAMLTMQSDDEKAAIAAEVFRLLAPGGRWAIHELGLTPDDLPDQVRDDVTKALSRTIKVGARPLTEAGWRHLATDAGFRVDWVGSAPMRLMEPSRVIADEGLLPAIRLFCNVMRNPAARQRIRAMRRVFRTHARHLQGIALIVTKPRT